MRGRLKYSESRVVIFDFDGTLADVIPMLREIYAQMAIRRGYPVIDDPTFRKLQNGSLKDAMRFIGVKPWQLPGVMNEGRKLFYKKRKEVKLFDGVVQLIKELDGAGWKIYILSSNSPTTIRSVMRREGIEHGVTVLKRPPLFGKAASIKKLVRKYRLDPNNVFMVGDEVRDIDAANIAGVNGVAVVWGLQTELMLKKARPYEVIKTVDALRKLFSNLGLQATQKILLK